MPGPAAPELAAAEPHRAGFDPPRLRRLDGFLARLAGSGKIPGWSMAIQRRSVLAHLSTGGYRDVVSGLPAEPGTLFRIYSMTKPVTAVAAMVLYERGDIELSDPVAHFLPTFARMRVFTGGPAGRAATEPAARPVTLWHLLTHTAGLTYGFHRAHPVDALYRQAGHDIEAPPGCSLAQACETWARLPLLFQPGTEWNYSVATDVLRDCGARRVALPEHLPAEWITAVPEPQLDRPPPKIAELARVDAVLTTVTVAIAQTGTLVLDHGPGQGRRELTLIPDVHVAVVPAQRIVAAVPDAVAAIDPATPLTWISGPSATSDIELTRVQGVHGPRSLAVIILE